MTTRPTRDKILEAALALLESDGAAAVSMRRIAERVGITPMGIYRHFPNREALLKEVTDQAFAAVAGEWARNARDPDLIASLLRAMENYLDFALQHPHLFDHTFSVRRDDARRFPDDFRARLSPTLNVVADLLVEGMRQGLFPEQDPWDAAMALWAQSHGLITLYRGGRFSYDDTEFRRFYRKSLGVVIHGIQS